MFRLGYRTWYCPHSLPGVYRLHPEHLTRYCIYMECSATLNCATGLARNGVGQHTPNRFRQPTCELFLRNASSHFLTLFLRDIRYIYGPSETYMQLHIA